MGWVHVDHDFAIRASKIGIRGRTINPCSFLFLSNMSTEPSLKVCPAMPGFGYLVIAQSHVAKFQQVGQRFFISYLSDLPSDEIEGKQVCLWLGAGKLGLCKSIHRKC